MSKLKNMEAREAIPGGVGTVSSVTSTAEP